LGEILKHFEEGIKHLKLSVRAFEHLDKRFAHLSGVNEIAMAHKETH